MERENLGEPRLQYVRSTIRLIVLLRNTRCKCHGIAGKPVGSASLSKARAQFVKSSVLLLTLVHCVCVCVCVCVRVCMKNALSHTLC